MLERMEVYLGEQGYDVRCAPSGAKAIECARQWDVELLISDSNPGDMHAMEMAAAIRQTRPRCRLILIAAPGETPEFSRVTTNRIIALLGKPFAPEDLMHFVSGAFSTAADGYGNRREHNLHAFLVEAQLTLINPFDDSESRPIASLMRDVSRSGVTMIVRQVLPVPAMLKINFNLKGNPNLKENPAGYSMLAKSASCTLTQIPGVYRLGAKFIGMLPRALEKAFVQMSHDRQGTHEHDIFMGKSFKEAALEWLTAHKDEFSPPEFEFTARMLDEMSREFNRPPSGDES
jgi:CheY-like chemotaxis protein